LEGKQEKGKRKTGGFLSSDGLRRMISNMLLSFE